MAIYSDTDFNNNKDLKFEPQLKPPGPASQDLHIGKLYRQSVPKDIYTSEGWANYLEEFKNLDIDSSWAKFRQKLEKIPTIDKNGEQVWIIEPGHAYLAESVEKLTLPKGLGVDVDTRSSWARYGIRIQHCDDDLEGFGGYEGHIPLLITNCDVPVVMRPGDRTCQAVVYEWDKGVLSNQGIFDAVKNGHVECFRRPSFNPELKTPSVNIDNLSIALTLHPVIKRFREKMLDPKEDNTGKYASTNLERGHEMPYRKFFLGSSNEVIQVDDEYVAILREIFTSPQNVRTHSNAGYIDPGFIGTITLEQYLVELGPNVLYPDMKMGEVEICNLKSKCTNPYKSKYSNQFGATASMGHLDFKKS